MIIKISPKVYINTDNITRIQFKTEPQPGGGAKYTHAHVYWQHGHLDYSLVSIETARHLLLMLEADESMLFEGEVLAMARPSDRSRIAQALRDTWLGGATQEQLETSLNANDGAFAEPLKELLAEGIVVAVIPEKNEAGDPLYYHANHAPRHRHTLACLTLAENQGTNICTCWPITPNRDLSIADEG